ncbi:MAG: GDP-L-fucose synthase [Candidatus Acidiferrum sp.]
MDKQAKIYVAGHGGMVGSALVRALARGGYSNLLLRDHRQMELTDQSQVNNFFEKERPDYVFLAAAKVGGILANDTLPAEFSRQNLAIEMNVLHAAYCAGVQRLLFLGSSCVYPKNAPQPIPESALLTGPLEATNRPYAVAKIAGIEMCWAYNRQYKTRFLTVMPSNLYGPNDNYDPEYSHVIPGLLVKFYQAKLSGAPQVVLWGTGNPRREFIHSDDAAQACLLLMSLPQNEFDQLVFNQANAPIVNIGAGSDLTIRELAIQIAEITGFRGAISFDPTKPGGTPRKFLDTSILTSLGWKPVISLREGLWSSYQEYLAQKQGATHAATVQSEQ